MLFRNSYHEIEVSPTKLFTVACPSKYINFFLSQISIILKLVHSEAQC